MKVKFIIILSIGLLRTIGQTGMNFEFNQIFLDKSPFYTDLTLDRNYQERAKRKIKHIILSHHPVNGPTKWDSTMIKDPKIAVKSYLGHGSKIEHYYYNDNGVQIRKVILPYYFKLNREDSIKLNSGEIIEVTSSDTLKIKKYFKSDCRYEEFYKNGLLIKNGRTGFCPSQYHVNGNTITYSEIWSEVFVYDSLGRVISSNRSAVEIWDSITNINSCKEYRYKKNIILITKYPNCKSSEEKLINVVKLNSAGKVLSSKYYDSDPKMFTAYFCRYDKSGNLTKIYGRYFKKRGKKELLYRFFNRYKNGKLEMIEYINNYGNKSIFLDESGKPIKIVNNGENYIETFDYH